MFLSFVHYNLSIYGDEFCFFNGVFLLGNLSWCYNPHSEDEKQTAVAKPGIQKEKVLGS
jgi:hypothetical protein